MLGLEREASKISTARGLPGVEPELRSTPATIEGGAKCLMSSLGSAGMGGELDKKGTW